MYHNIRLRMWPFQRLHCATKFKSPEAFEFWIHTRFKSVMKCFTSEEIPTWP